MATELYPRSVYLINRANALARIKQLAAGRTVVPLDEVAGLLPTLPEWEKFERPIRGRRKPR